MATLDLSDQQLEKVGSLSPDQAKSLAQTILRAISDCCEKENKMIFPLTWEMIRSGVSGAELKNALQIYRYNEKQITPPSLLLASCRAIAYGTTLAVCIAIAITPPAWPLAAFAGVGLIAAFAIYGAFVEARGISREYESFFLSCSRVNEVTAAVLRTITSAELASRVSAGSDSGRAATTVRDLADLDSEAAESALNRHEG